MISQLRACLVVFLLLTVVTGFAYPLAITVISATVFPDQARGSVIEVNGKPVGSALIGQAFTNPGYFWSRPSATSPFSNKPDSGSGSNAGPTNPALADAIKSRIAALQAADPTNTSPIPVELVTASASGLDPDISPAAAAYQAPRVARARNLSPEQINATIADHTAGRTFGILGEPRVNVLALNLALDRLSPLNATPATQPTVP